MSRCFYKLPGWADETVDCTVRWNRVNRHFNVIYIYCCTVCFKQRYFPLFIFIFLVRKLLKCTTLRCVWWACVCLLYVKVCACLCECVCMHAYTYNGHPLADVVEVEDGQQCVCDGSAQLCHSDSTRGSRPEHKTKVPGCCHQRTLIWRLGLIHQLS